MAWTTLKIAVFAPMPSARVSTATAVKPGFFSSWRKANLRSFMTERLHRINSRSAPCRQPTCDTGHEHEQQRHASERHWIGRAHAVKQTRHQAGRRQCSDEADDRPEQNQFQALANH